MMDTLLVICQNSSRINLFPHGLGYIRTNCPTFKNIFPMNRNRNILVLTAPTG